MSTNNIFTTYASNHSKILVNNLVQKNSINRFIFYSLIEGIKKFSMKPTTKENSSIISRIFNYTRYGGINYSLKRRLAVNLVFRDMIHNYKIWRHIKGYPVNGQRTWSNGKSVTKNNNLFKNFRINQILTAYGKKRRNKAPQLIVGEYVNKLWLKTWKSEWKQARKFNLKQARRRGRNNTIVIDLKSLASCITGGYTRKGKARRFNKAKKKFNNITIGLPILFTRHIYTKVYNKKFLVDFSLMHEQRKMKARRRVKSKVNPVKKKKKKK